MAGFGKVRRGLHEFVSTLLDTAIPQGMENVGTLCADTFVDTIPHKEKKALVPQTHILRKVRGKGVSHVNGQLPLDTDGGSDMLICGSGINYANCVKTEAKTLVKKLSVRKKHTPSTIKNTNSRRFG